MNYVSSETLLNAINDGYWDWNLRTNELFLSREWKAMLGYTENDLENCTLSDWDALLHPRDKRETYKKIDEHLQGKTEIYRAEFRLRCKDGTYKWILGRGRVVERDDAGHPVRMIGTQSDIEQNKQLELDLRKNEQYLRSIVEDQREMICRFNHTGKITFANQAFLNFTGLGLHEIYKTSFFSFVQKNEQNLVKVYFDSALAKERVRENEIHMQRKDGEIRNINWRCHWLPFAEEDKSEFQLVGQDVTELKQVFDQFKTRSTVDRMISEILARFTSFTGDDYDEIIASSMQDLGQALAMDRVSIIRFNYAKETMSVSSEWCREGVQSYKQTMQDQLLSTFPWVIDQLGVKKEIRLSKPSDLPDQAVNERRWLEKRKTQSTLMVPVELSSNRLIGFLCFESLAQRGKWDSALVSQLKLLTEVIANTIENKNAENLVRANEARERLFIDALPALIMRVDNAGLIMDYISGCHGILSQYISLLEPAPGTPLGTVFPNETAQALLAKAAEFDSEENRYGFEFEIEVAGKTATVEARFAEIKEDEIMIIIQDISEKKKLEQQKTDFINNATHEMRTPLTTIMLMIDLLEKQNESLKKQQYWEVLKGEVGREKLLIEQLLSVSRIERGQFRFSQKNLDLLPVLHEAIEMLYPQAEAKGITVHLSIPSDPVFINADTNAVQIIFTNLLSNAIKFSDDESEIGVDVKTSADLVRVIFWDKGIGIPEEDLPHVFDRFTRGSNAIAEEIQGSGIGLFIVRYLMQSFGGSVVIDSKIAAGTRVTLSFPALKKIE